MNPLRRRPRATGSTRQVHWRYTSAKRACPRSKTTTAAKGVGKPGAFAAVRSALLCSTARRDPGAGEYRDCSMPAGGNTARSDSRNRLTELEKSLQAETCPGVCMRKHAGKSAAARGAGKYRDGSKPAGGNPKKSATRNRLSEIEKSVRAKTPPRVCLRAETPPRNALFSGVFGCG